MHCSPIQCSSAAQRPRSRSMIAAALMLFAAGLMFIAQAFYIHAKAIVAQILLDRAFAQSLESGEIVKPWSWADTWPVARLEVKRIGATAVILAGSSGQALAFGPGHVEATPLPGDPGQSVLAAHRDTHFGFIGDVKMGDTISVTRMDGVKTDFVVTGTSVVRWDNSGIAAGAPTTIGAGRAMAGLVLSTCWPLSARTQGPLRYLVHARARS